MRTKVKYYIVSGRTVETVISRIDINARYQKPRRKRIAAGAGVTVQDVNALIRQFEQMQKMMKQMMGNKKAAFRAMRNMNIR